MDGWETVLAALGGLLLGLGLGLTLGRRRESGLRRKLTLLDSGLRRSVIPVLEDRALAIGLPVGERSRESTDPVRVSLELSASIRRFEESQDLPFSDTLEIDAEHLKGAIGAKDLETLP